MGQYFIVDWLIEECKVEAATCDIEGRNMMHIALMNQQLKFFDEIFKYHKELLRTVDNKQFNVLHYIVMSKDAEQLVAVITGVYCDEKERENMFFC